MDVKRIGNTLDTEFATLIIPRCRNNCDKMLAAYLLILPKDMDGKQYAFLSLGGVEKFFQKIFQICNQLAY